MTGLALALVLSSAVIHATWNLVAKRVRGGAVFIWVMTWLTALIYAPLNLWLIATTQPTFGATQLLFISVSACLHIGYFILLTRGYKVGDLSLVYPLARGTGPMLSTVAAVLFLGERPTLLAFAGAACIGVGVFILTGDPRKFRENGAGTAVLYALLTGFVIACYTLWDKQGVTLALISPLLYDWSGSIMRGLILTPYALAHRDDVRYTWTTYRREAILVAVLSPLSYILVLTALTFSPVSYVAPAREISILVGAALGARYLSEGDTTRRLAAASVMVIGVVALAFG